VGTSFPNDALMRNILAEAYLKTGQHSRAVSLLDNAFENIIGERHLVSLEEIEHPAWCNDCLKQIRGVRILCTRCFKVDGYECCMQCLKEERGKPHPCRDHTLVTTPSWAKLEF